MDATRISPQRRRRAAAAGQAHRRVVSTATSRPASRTRRSCSTRRSSARTPAIRRSSRARRWPTGRTASCTCTRARRAPSRPSARSRAGSAFHASDVVADQRVHRRRLRQPDPRLHRDGDSGAAVEEGERAGDDAHHARRGSLHRPRAPGAALAREGRLRTKTAASRRSTASSWSENGPYDQVGDGGSAGDVISLAYQPKAMRLRASDGADQHAAARRAARAGRHAGHRRHGADPGEGGAASSASIEVEIRKINAPGRQGAVRRRQRRAASSST